MAERPRAFGGLHVGGIVAVASRGDLERLSIALLQNEMPVPRPVRLLGVSLSSLQGDDQEESQLGLPI
jgi:DNA polymerase-4